MKHADKSFSAIIIEYDEGLRIYLLQIYTYMCLALALTGVASMFAASSDVLTSAVYTMLNDTIIGLSPFGWLVLFVPIGIAFGFGFSLQQMSALTSQILFWMYSILFGLSLSFVYLLYTRESLASIFFVTSSTFGAMSIYGYAAKRNLSSLGAFLSMGLIGIIVASFVSLFLRSSGVNLAVSILSVLTFTTLTALNTQRIKSIYETSNKNKSSKAPIVGALTLYLDFINIFIRVLQLSGQKRMSHNHT